MASGRPFALIPGAIVLLIVSVGCTSKDGQSFWDMKPDPRAYHSDQSKYGQ
jgi:hypothetical protein